LSGIATVIRRRHGTYCIVAILLGLMLSTGCASRRNDTNPPALPGTHWLAEEINGSGVVADSLSTLVFSAETEGQVNGNAGCNLYFGTVAIEGNTMLFGPLGATLRMCADDALMQQERHFLDALENTRNFRFSQDGKTLTLADADAEGLIRLSRMSPDDDN